MTIDPEAEALAKRRFMLLNLVRLSGAALVLLGLAIAQGVIELPVVIGIILAAAGLFEFFFLPRLVARKWRSGER